METEHTVKSFNLTENEARLAQMMKALGHPARMQIVRYLSGNPQCITNGLVDVLPLAQATVSQHLKVLRDAGLISGTIEGPAMSYCLEAENFAWLKEQVNGLF